ncbi:MAG: hypothetical protein R3C01_14985 [Planctomycetaceae bacterium]
MVRLFLTGMLLMSLVATGRGGEIGYVEDFTLATDREAALKQLIPGTQDYYYWHSVHYLNTEQFAKVDELLPVWVQRHGETEQVWEIRTRKALLTYPQNPQQSLDYLKGRFGINYPHRKAELNEEPNLPTTLDPALVSAAAFQARAFAIHGNSLNGFEDAALERLVAEKLNPDQRRQLLSRIVRPDVAGLVPLIVADLNHQNSGGFGSHGIHGRLLLAQLDELLKLKPELLNQQAFVRAYLTRLQPGPDVDWRHDAKETAAYLERLHAFATRLDPVHNSLKAHVIYHRLLLDRKLGTYDEDRFLSYLKLPRPTGYLSKTMRESEELKRFACDLNSNYDGTTLLAPIGNDEPLVRSYLSHFFLKAGNTQTFEPYVNDVYLKHLFAEVKIVNGLGDAEQWASLLPPEQYRRLKDRIDLDFDYANRTQFSANDPVSLDLHIKNVSTLIVKVFAINTRNYYQQHGREIDTDINLDGLVANVEETHRYEDSPLLRVHRKFEFPALSQSGVYVVDFIGNGQSSRALIRKGELKHLVRTTPLGQQFTLLDGEGAFVKKGTVWISGHEYTANDDGTIDVPFSTSPGRQPVVLSAPSDAAGGDSFSALSHFEHEGENYQLTAGFHVERESLLTRKEAELIIRPGLTVNGTPVSLKLLEEITLTMTSTDHDGIQASVNIPNVELFEDRETTHRFLVPPRLSAISFSLTAKIRLVTTGEQIGVASSDQFTVNQIDKTDKIEDLHLLRSQEGSVVELRGRTGEPKGSRPVTFQFRHRDFRDLIHVVLKTDPRGRVTLGKLDGIVAVTATGPEGTSKNWPIDEDRHTYSAAYHSRVDEPILLPYLGRPIAPAQWADAGRSEVSLLELRGNQYSIDRFEQTSLEQGQLKITGLPAGDFNLRMKSSGIEVLLRVVPGKAQGSYIVGPTRQLETRGLQPVQIESIQEGGKSLAIQLRNATKFTRVHVFATRYVPEFDSFSQLGKVRGAELYTYHYSPAQSVYLTGRNIGDEYRYIIDRKYAHKFPGNMLERPSLLLNPWAVRETQTGEQLAEAGTEFDEAGARPTSGVDRLRSDLQRTGGPTGHFANLDFLGEAAPVFVNLTPNAEGIIQVPLEALGSHSQIHVVAIDPIHTTIRTHLLPEKQATFVDLRLADGLDPAGHFTRQKEITVVPVGQQFTLHDISTAKFESYDSLARVYGLYATLNTDQKLTEFSFAMNWPKLKDEEKRTLYSKYASHELSFFLFKKDPAFFKEVVQPYLANKKDKTFMDHFLLEDDLSDYLQPWRYGQLNVVERILLARRIEEERPRTARHISDGYAALPPNVDRFIRLFDTAVQQGALESGDALGLNQARKQLEAGSLKGFGSQNGIADRGMGGSGPAAPPAPEMAAAEKPQQMMKEQQRQVEALEKAKKSMERDGSLRSRRAAGDMAERELAEANFRKESDFYDAKAATKRVLVRPLYRKLSPTWEWAENNYYHLTIDQQGPVLIPLNSFWKDFANHDPNTPFYSRNLAEASSNFPEMLLALAVLDLPFESPKHDSKFDGTQMTLTPGGPLVVFHDEIRPAAAPDGAAKVLVSQNFYRHGDRHRVENGERVDKFVTDEFLIHVVYGCQVVMTNPTSTRQKLNVLVQNPQGSLPVLNGQVTRTLHIDLEPYHTQTVEYQFYFPAAGEFPQFPVHVARNETLIAAAAPAKFKVVDRPTNLDVESWDYISQHGTLEQVVQYLETHNVVEIDLNRIAWRMHDKNAFDTLLSLLTNRHAYHDTLWSYSLLHNVVGPANEFLQHHGRVANECGGRIVSPLLTVDPVRRRTYEHLEYKPLVNARTHSLGQRRQIVNDRFHSQYHRFLKELSYDRTLSDTALLDVTYYLFLQDRIEEALATFAKVNRERVATKMQYDYCAAYAHFFSDEPQLARAIAEKYLDHPVDRWRQTFAVVTAQLDEATGQQVAIVDPENRDQQQAALAATEPVFDFTVDQQKIQLNYQNLEAATVNFYEMDVELLFSRNPFVQRFDGNFASIKPNHSLSVKLPKGKAEQSLNLPDALKNSNVLVEIVAGGQTKTQPYFSNSLVVQVVENYGQVKVTHRDTKRPVPKAYVKVYAESADGSVKFYKDGYTDLRGRFDYASLSTRDLETARRFSILILSDDHGALVREAAPPKQ